MSVEKVLKVFISTFVYQCYLHEWQDTFSIVTVGIDLIKSKSYIGKTISIEAATPTVF